MLKSVLLKDLLVNEGFFEDYESADQALEKKLILVNTGIATKTTRVFSGLTMRIEVKNLPSTWEPRSHKVKEVEALRKGKGLTIYKKGMGSKIWDVKVQENYAYTEDTFLEKQKQIVLKEKLPKQTKLRKEKVNE